MCENGPYCSSRNRSNSKNEDIVGANIFPMLCYGRKQGTVDGLLENVSSSTYHCNSGNHCGPVADLPSSRPHTYIYRPIYINKKK